jgi:hypothetical protein
MVFYTVSTPGYSLPRPDGIELAQRFAGDTAGIDQIHQSLLLLWRAQIAHSKVCIIR